MDYRIKRDIKIGIITGLIGFFVIVLPVFKLMDWVATLEIGQKVERLYEATIYYLYNEPNENQ